MPPATGWSVQANLHLTLQLEDGRQLQTPLQGLLFRFEWHPPDKAGFAALRERLKKLLAEWMLENEVTREALTK